MVEEQKFEEQPTLEEEATPAETETEVPVEESQEDVVALLAELKKAGVKTDKQLQGKLQASAEAGNLARLLGENRQELAEVKELLADKGGKPADVDDYSGGESIDLKDIMKQVIQEDRVEQNKQAMRVQQQNMAQWDAIQKDKDYGLVQPVWETKLQDPAFVYKIQTGQVNPVMEYMETVRDMYKGMNIRSANVIEQLQTGGKIDVPHVEGGERTPPLRKEDTDVTRQKLDSYRERVDRGDNLSEEEQMDALMGVLRR